MRNLGQQIRVVREQKGIGLNEYAKHLGVSPAYLSNLETGKTETIQLSLLNTLLSELDLIQNVNFDELSNPFAIRLQRISQLLKQLNDQNPKAADFLLSTIERGIEIF